MPRLIVTEGAAKGLERCRRFLSDKDPQVARRAAQAIERQFARLEESPEVGRPFPDLPELRELIIEFGDSGYVALYRYERADDTAYVLAFRHQKKLATEAGQQLPGSRQESTPASPNKRQASVFPWRNRGAGNVGVPSSRPADGSGSGRLFPVLHPAPASSSRPCGAGHAGSIHPWFPLLSTSESS